MKFITCDRCGCDVSAELLKHVAVYAIGGRLDIPRLEYCLDCGEALAGVLEEFGTAARGETPAERRQREDEEMRARNDAWRATAGEQRQRLILETLGPERLTVTQIADRLTKKHREQYGKIFDTTLRNEVRRMLDRGELARERCDKDKRVRYVYFRPTGLHGPIAQLQAMLLDEERANG